MVDYLAIGRQILIMQCAHHTLGHGGHEFSAGTDLEIEKTQFICTCKFLYKYKLK